MLTIDEIKSKLAIGEYELSLHALRRIVERNISKTEICEAGENIQILEEYPEDKYGPSCLLLGLTRKKRPIHLHVSRIGKPSIKIITLYEPTSDEWIDYKLRK